MPPLSIRSLSAPLDPGLTAEEKKVVDGFHRLYYSREASTWRNTTWLGIPVTKCPLDLWIYQEIFHLVRPDVVVEAGTYRGGGAYFLATLCDLFGRGRVYTIDIRSRPPSPAHPRLEYVAGSSIDAELVAGIESRIEAHETVLVILDSDHSEGHVRAELELFHSMVSPGSYLIVEDTNVNGNPVFPEHGPGPKEAVVSFLADHPEFVVDADCEKFLLTFNPGGFLRRVSRGAQEPVTPERPERLASGERAEPAVADGVEEPSDLRRAVGELSRRLWQQEDLIDRLRIESDFWSGGTQRLEALLLEKDREYAALREFADTQESETSRYVASLRGHLEAKEDQLQAQEEALRRMNAALADLQAVHAPPTGFLPRLAGALRALKGGRDGR